jgi:hypothetical protein
MGGVGMMEEMVSEVDVTEEREIVGEREGHEMVREEMTGEELAVVRELALRAHPDVVPELVSGGSVGEIVASVEAARAAYRRVAEGIGQGTGATTVAVVPAGGAPRVVVDADALPAAEKIRRALAGRGRGGMREAK